MLLGLPSITPFSFSERNLVGSQVKITCFAGGGGKLSWLKDGIPVKESLDDLIVQYFNGLLILSIESVQPKHAGNYTCHAEGPDGSSNTHSSYLAVSAPPEWTSVQEDLVITKWTNKLELQCRASGYPTPNISWVKDNGQSTFQRKSIFFFLSPRDNFFHALQKFSITVSV